MADINNPKEFLNEALTLVDMLEADKLKYRQDSDNTEQLGWVHNAHYLVIVKPDAIELHKYPDSFKNVTTIKTISRNTSFEDKAVHDIVFGTYVKDDVNYIVFAIDGGSFSFDLPTITASR